MPYQVLFDEESGTVQVIFSGEAKIDDHFSALNAAISLCSEQAVTRLLVDFSGLNSSNLSTLDCFSFAKAVARLDQKFCVAHVLSKNSQVRENIRFASNVEANRGRITKEFENVEDAISWLNRKT